ncbi:MAG: double-strand break repair protein AddB [Proteobacteria bacterium]|nr:double-strand break repair protein AddB [Pseudomonadota bacterium]
MTVYNVPAGIPFARALAAELLQRTKDAPQKLASYRIFLPTRRACRAMRDAFLKESGGQPLLLPRLQPLGDIDPEEMTLEFAASGSGAEMPLAPAAMPPLQRQMMLARMAMKAEGFAHSPAHALEMAGALGRLMDRIHTEGLDMADLPRLAPEDFAAHWQVTLKFLEIITAQWPEILKERGMADAAWKRNELIRALTAHWRINTPQTPVIAAGTTGSIPATADLLKVISGLPRGEIVLPGLDSDMDDESWDALDDNHPQATLRHLLRDLGIERNGVQIWPGTGGNDPRAQARRHLCRELMRPAATTAAWADLSLPQPEKAVMKRSLEGVMRLDCNTPQEEAKAISILLRRSLNDKGKTAALVTPDRGLARRVAAHCRRWNIEIDDSAGAQLSEMPAGVFLRLCARAAAEDFAPGALLSLLRHKSCLPGKDADDLNILEECALRGPKPGPGIAAIRRRIDESGENPERKKNAIRFLNRFEAAITPLSSAWENGEKADFPDALQSHIAAAENLAGGAENLWKGEDGEEAAQLLAELRENADFLPPVSRHDYADILTRVMHGATVRKKTDTHPRLSILGQMEARMVHADTIILGGLNEGTWPPGAGYDPWMSRPMMKKFGLPPPERHIGLAAHDFAQGFCAPNVVLTRSKKAAGAPTIAARWLQRLDVVLAALGLPEDVLTARGAAWLAAVRAIDHAERQKPSVRPCPAPALPLRPRSLSVTKIETWMRDPYGIYAQYILKLKKLDPVEMSPGAADKGSILHGVLNEFIRAHKTGLPANAADILKDLGRKAIDARADDPGFWDFWWPRFERIADWFVENEAEWRMSAAPLATEIGGQIAFSAPAGPFALTARADRIDRMADGSAAIIDYKSGGNYAATAIRSGEAPQLPLEALILREGGFQNIPASQVTCLGYWVLTGGDTPAKITAIEDGAGEAADKAGAGLSALLAAFDNPDTPYYSLPDPDRAPRFNDYEHLARVKEWVALDDSGSEAA